MFRLLLLGVLTLAMAGVWATVKSKDPTRPLRAPAPKVTPGAEVPAAVELRSVLIGPERRLAVINDHVLAEGEEHAGIKVWRIHADRVVVSVAGREPMTLMLDKARIYKEVR